MFGGIGGAIWMCNVLYLVVGLYVLDVGYAEMCKCYGFGGIHNLYVL